MERKMTKRSTRRSFRAALGLLIAVALGGAYAIAARNAPAGTAGDVSAAFGH
jgi:hypothetical protein